MSAGPFTPFANPGKPNTGLSGVAGGLMDFISALSGANANRLNNEQVRQQIAQKQLDRLTQIIQSDPAKQSNPQYIAQAKLLAQRAGLPSPVRDDVVTPSPNGGRLGALGVTVTPATTDAKGNPVKPTPGQVPVESLDMSVLAPKKPFTDLPQAVIDNIPYMSKASRQALAASVSGFPPGLMDIQREFTSEQTNHAISQVTKIADSIGSGKSGDVQLAADQIAQLTTLHDGPLSPEIAQDALNEAIGPMAAARMSDYQAAGMNQRALAVQHEVYTQYLPQQIMARINQGQENADTRRMNEQSEATYRTIMGGAAMTNAQSHVDQATAAIANAETNADKKNYLVYSGQISTLSKKRDDLYRLQQTLNNNIAQLGTFKVSAGKVSDPNSPAGKLAAVTKALQAVDGEIQTVQDRAAALPGVHLQRASGNPDVNVGDDKKPGAQVPGPIKTIIQDMQRQGKTTQEIIQAIQTSKLSPQDKAAAIGSLNGPGQ